MTKLSTNYDLTQLDPRAVAGITLIGRTGAVDFNLRYSEDPEPVVWIASAHYTKPRSVWECAAGLDPVTAVMRLCTELIDGGECQGCRRAAIFFDEDGEPGEMLSSMGCVYSYREATQSFERSCEP